MVYDYVRRMYGVDPVIGHRIRCHASGEVATIIRPQPEDQYVHARVDGEKRRSRFHPTAIDYLGGGADREGGR